MSEKPARIPRSVERPVGLTGASPVPDTLNAILAVHRAFGAPGEYGYNTPQGEALNQLYDSYKPLADSISGRTNKTS